MEKSLFTIRVATIFSALLVSTSLLAQDPDQSSKGEVVLVNPGPLIYPPLARQVRISSDVELVLRLVRTEVLLRLRS